MKRRLDAVEMWLLRRMLRVSWTARLTKERAMEMAGVRRELPGAARKRQLDFLGDLLRHDCLEKDVFLGKIEGRRARSRQRLKFGFGLVEDIPGEMTAGRIGAAGARSREVAFHGHPRQPRHGTSLR